jgi:predicted O-methyltransferase YrrM
MASLNENIEVYIEMLNRPLEKTEWDPIYDEAVRLQIPVVRKNTARLIYILIKLKNPQNVLEIGTGSGFSTLWIEHGLSENARLTSLERDKNRYEKASILFKDHSKIHLLYQDAFDYLKEPVGTFDFVFLDSQKRDYIDFLPLLEKKLVSGGVLVIDNFLFQGKVVSMTPDEEKKYKGGVDLLKKFNEELAKHPAFDTLFLHLDDGVVIAVKK